jgi:hypothetical protein
MAKWASLYDAVAMPGRARFDDQAACSGTFLRVLIHSASHAWRLDPPTFPAVTGALPAGWFVDDNIGVLTHDSAHACKALMI